MPILYLSIIPANDRHTLTIKISIIQMSIIYSVVVRQDENGQQMTLCNYDTAQGNYPSITEQILKKIKLHDGISYRYNDQYIYHIKKDGNLLFVCLADRDFKIRTAFAFLQQILKKFKQKYSEEQISNAFAYGMSNSFSQIYKQQFIYHNTHKDNERREEINKELQRLQLQMGQNIQKVMQRERGYEMTVKKGNNMQSIAKQIKERSNQINHETFWVRHKRKLVIVGIVVIVGVVILLAI